MNLQDLEQGKSYACKFSVMTFVNDQGMPVDTRNLAPGQAVDGKPEKYESLGIIKTRDIDKELVELVDEKNRHRTFVVAWEDCWDVDEVEWIDNV